MELQERDRLLGQLFHCISTNTCGAVVDLDCNGFSVNGTQAFARALSTNSTIASLCLQNIKEASLATVLSALAFNASLTQLDLRYNRLTDGGAELISKLLVSGARLQRLHLHGNCIGPSGCSHLAETLKWNDTLLELNLRYNSVGDEGAKALASGLERNLSVRLLHLSCNGITHEGAQCLAHTLLQNSTLQHLDLYGNEIGEVGVGAFVTALTQNQTLYQLELTQADSRIRELLVRNRLSNAAGPLPFDPLTPSLLPNPSTNTVGNGHIGGASPWQPGLLEDPADLTQHSLPTDVLEPLTVRGRLDPQAFVHPTRPGGAATAARRSASQNSLRGGPYPASFPGAHYNTPLSVGPPSAAPPPAFYTQSPGTQAALAADHLLPVPQAMFPIPQAAAGDSPTASPSEFQPLQIFLSEAGHRTVRLGPPRQSSSPSTFPPVPVPSYTDPSPPSTSSLPRRLSLPDAPQGRLPAPRPQGTPAFAPPPVAEIPHSSLPLQQRSRTPDLHSISEPAALEVLQWLRDMGLAACVPVLLAEGFDTLEKVLQVTEEDCREMKFRLADRKLLLKALSRLHPSPSQGGSQGTPSSAQPQPALCTSPTASPTPPPLQSTTSPERVGHAQMDPPSAGVPAPAGQAPELVEVFHTSAITNAPAVVSLASPTKEARTDEARVPSVPTVEEPPPTAEEQQAEESGIRLEEAVAMDVKPPEEVPSEMWLQVLPEEGTGRRHRSRSPQLEVQKGGDPPQHEEAAVPLAVDVLVAPVVSPAAACRVVELDPATDSDALYVLRTCTLQVVGNVPCSVRRLWKVDNPTLQQQYEQWLQRLGNLARGGLRQEEDLSEVAGYHGCPPHLIDRICEYGLLRAGHPANPTPPLDSGANGDPRCGVNLGCYPEGVLQYTRRPARLPSRGQRVCILRFCVLPGKMHQLSKSDPPGLRPTPGSDSHLAVDQQAWFLFHEGQCFPTHVLEVELMA